MGMAWLVLGILGAACAGVSAVLLVTRRWHGEMGAADRAFAGWVPRRVAAIQVAALACFTASGALATRADLTIRVLNVIFFGVATIAAVVFLLAFHSGLLIRPEGVEIRSQRRTRLIGWGEVDADPYALFHAGLRGPGIDPPDVDPARDGRLTLRSLDVEPDRVAQVLRYYRDRPESRAAIGDPDEYTRMRADADAHDRLHPSDQPTVEVQS